MILSMIARRHGWWLWSLGLVAAALVLLATAVPVVERDQVLQAQSDVCPEFAP